MLRWNIIGLIGALLLMNGSISFAEDTIKEKLLVYVQEKLKKDDGGYGWEDQPDSHFTPTYASIGILYHLLALPENKEEILNFLANGHPQFGKNKEAGPSGTELRNLDYERIQAIQWLDGDASTYIPQVQQWKSLAGKLANYESNGFPCLFQEMMTPICKDLLQIPVEDGEEIEGYLKSRRRQNGSFNNAPAEYGGDGNIINTYYALKAFSVIGFEDDLKEETSQWIKACQLPSGGFTHQPHPQLGATDDVIYTWAAINSLDLMNENPKKLNECIAYLMSLRNADGGFGNKPGIPSDPTASFYVVDALKTLNALEKLNDVASSVMHAEKDDNLSGLNIYAVQFQAPGSGSPKEAVLLADSLNINLWGAKNADPEWITTAQSIADKNNVQVIFFPANEPYNKNVLIPGMGSFSHIMDYIAPSVDKLPDLKDSFTWEEGGFHALKGNGGLLLQVSNNEPLARMLLDESIINDGYIGISTIHFSQNFAFFLPYLYQYRNQLPFVALQDAHGEEPWWWGRELAGYRTLFLAKEPTFDGLMEAFEKNHLVAVRHDSVSYYKTRMMGGKNEVRDYISEQENEWKWWDEENSEPYHPWAAITVLYPEDTLEAGRPETGESVRIRCLWAGLRNTLHYPIVALDQLKVNGKIISTEYKEIKDRRGRTVDAYYLAKVPDVSGASMRIEAHVSHQLKGAKKVINVIEYLPVNRSQ